MGFGEKNGCRVKDFDFLVTKGLFSKRHQRTDGSQTFNSPFGKTELFLSWSLQFLDPS